jgi:hypothetical protein
MMRNQSVSLLALTLMACTGEERPVASVGSNVLGLEIVGTRTQGTTRVSGPLNIETLVSDLRSGCLAEVAAAFPGLCYDRNALDRGDCQSHGCLLEVNLCLGHKIMEIGDEVKLFDYSANQRNLAKVQTKGAQFTYTIPPQSAANRTLAYRLASEAFGAAGERGVDAINDPSCMTQVMATAAEPDVTRNRAEIFAVAYGDVVQSFSEATDKLVANEVHVAGDKSQTVRDFSESREHVWNDQVNSIRSAAAALARADGEDPGQNLRLPMVLRPADDDATQAAIAFLRAEPMASILDPLASDEDVVDDVQAGFRDDFPGLYPVAEDRAAFLSRFNLSLADVAEARLILRDEHVVFDRTMLETTPGSGRIAGLASPPEPLPAAAALARTAGARALASTSVTHPAYRASGALQMLDYLRWGARKALRQSEAAPSLLTPTLRPLFSAAAVIGETESGHRRLEVTPIGSPPGIDLDEIPIPPTTLALRLHGVAESDKFLIVRSMDGVRCVLGGSVEGAACDPSDYLLATDSDFEAGDNYDQQMDGTQTFYVPGGGDQVFVVDDNGPRPDVEAGFDRGALTDIPGGGILAAIGGALGVGIRDITTPKPYDPGLPQLSCPGLPADLVVPLESEITEDNDPYENSWKHYLDLADQMAREADALGEELIRAGLELDVRGEAARDELEAICGGVVNVADVFDEAANGGGTPEELISDEAQQGQDASLETCLPRADRSDIEPWVTLGSEDLCAWRYRALPPCVCPEEVGNCGGRCPAPRGDRECALPPEIAGNPDFVLIPTGGEVRRLGLLPAPATSTSTPDCSALARLRPRDEPLEGRARDRLIAELRSQDWFNPRVMHQLVASTTYDEDWRDELSISVFGSGVFSTTTAAGLPPCADPVSAADVRWSAPLLFPDPIVNICVSEDGSEDRTRRRRWIADMRRAFGTLGLISGALDGNMTRSDAFDCSEFGDGEVIELLGNPSEGICSIEALGLEGGARCLFEADPSDPDFENTAYGNVVCPYVRTDRTKFASFIEAGGTAALNRLWGLAQGNEGESTIPDILERPAGPASVVFDWGAMLNLGVASILSSPPAGSNVALDETLVSDDLASLTHEDVYNALAVGCYLALTQGGGCETFNPTEVPEIRSPEDLQALERHLLCAADGILTSAGRSLLANVPKVVADSVGSGQPLSLYPGFRGELLDAMVALQTDIEQAAMTTNAIQNEVRRAAYTTSLARQALQTEEVRGELTQLQNLAQMLATITNALAASVQSFGLGSVASAGAAAELVILDQVGALEAELTQLEQGTILLEYAQQSGDIMAELTRLGSELRDTVFRLNADLGRVESLRSRALSLAARAAFMDRDESGRVFQVTTVMRRRYNTGRIRYERARDRARQMAFIARRAIEQRFGVGLEQIRDDLTLVEAPATWANDLCSFEGIDYARIRQAQIDEQVAEEDRVPENYADGYLGDYVQKLRLFVESYPFDFPFQDGNDLGVISLRDDVFRTKVECEVVVPNLLASSEDVTGTEGEDPAEAPWRVEGCGDANGDGAVDPCLAVASHPGIVWDGAWRNGNRVADQDIDMEAPTGVLVQEIQITDTPVDLLVSWTDRFLSAAELAAIRQDDLRVDAPVPYEVILERIGAGPDERVPGTFEPIVRLEDAQLGEPRQLGVLTVLAPGTVRLTIDPSAEDLERGDVWLAQLQIEAIGPGEEAAPSAYMPTVRAGHSILKVCPDVDGEVMRQLHFADREELLCPAGLGRDCDEDGGNVRRILTFHEATFGLGLGQIERGEIIPSAQIALGNYNYRHDLVAVNLVGTNVRDCSESDEPATCYSNAFIPFTLVHEGEDIPIRNHSGETVPFDFERAFIEHGKALASEVVLTNPLTGSAETLLGPYYKQELRGRPLMGHYTLRIWDDPSLTWQNVEDVQLVFRYRYWTRFGR